MSARLPIGERESQQLEFKAADALRKPFTLSREVVALLNGGGGDLWIGIREQDGIATACEDVGDPQAAWQRLFDHLLEVVEPRLAGEVGHEAVADEQGHRALVLHLRPNSASHPYALLQERGRHFLLRVDHRLRYMTRDELLGGATQHDSSRAELRRRRDAALRSRASLLWMGAQPRPPLRLDLQAAGLSELLTDPTRSGNRRSGWNFRVPLTAPVLRAEHMELGRADLAVVLVHRHGGIDFTLALDWLEHGGDRSRHAIYPLALLEYVISIARLARAVCATAAAGAVSSVLLDIALAGAERWTLPPYPPGTQGHVHGHGPPAALEDGTYAPTEPLEVPWRELDEHADRAGFRLVRGIYQAFGLPEERIPRDYDRRREQLLLTD